jgi:hypothetical protein
VGEFSNKQVWWKCKNGCSFKSIIADRSNGGGCHYCSKTYKRVSIDNCLASLYPSLVSEWHPTKNGKLTPYNVIGGSRKKVWWKCKINPEHEWPAILASRSVMGTNCPYCNGVLLKDDMLCASQAEAIKYIEYKEKGLIFKHNKPYHKSFGKRRYDFYFPEENKYVEVTSFNKTWYSKKPGIYFNYLRKIVKKRRFVKNILKAKFEFIKFVPTKEQKKKLKEWIK